MFWLFGALSLATLVYICFTLACMLVSFRRNGYRLRHAGRSIVYLTAIMIVCGMLAYAGLRQHVSFAGMMTVIVCLQLLTAISIVISVRRQLRTTVVEEAPAISDHALPTVTVAVPARNEDAQMEDCINSILSSNYPKLEILVLDDSSHDRTPEIIRSFAQAGVRFIGGDEPKTGWLPKNQAYDRLVSSASGELILFCGVDVRLAPQTIRRLVAVRAARHKSMITILPQNHSISSVPVLQAMRYYWEMAPPRRLFRRPPVMSSCWLVERRLLNAAGGFAAVRRSVTPEAHFAHQAMMANDGYSFFRSSELFSIHSEKPTGEQRETALYSRYPQVHRRPELVLLLTFLEALVLLGPIVVIPLSIVHGIPVPLTAVAILALVINVLAFGSIQRVIFSNIAYWRCCLSFVLSLLSDIYYLNFSMYKYEFGEVTWKGRNVRPPVMQRGNDMHNS